MEPRKPPSAATVCSNLQPLELKLQEDVIQHLRKWYGEEELNKMLKALATPPKQTTIRVNTLRITRNELIDKLKEHCEKVQRIYPHWKDFHFPLKLTFWTLFLPDWREEIFVCC
jgi:16S rRNA C967 or C1407 C5-methylase (RsmB/RsmF family)